MSSLPSSPRCVAVPCRRPPGVAVQPLSFPAAWPEKDREAGGLNTVERTSVEGGSSKTADERLADSTEFE